MMEDVFLYYCLPYDFNCGACVRACVRVYVCVCVVTVCILWCQR